MKKIKNIHPGDALGGIKTKNIKMIDMTKAYGVAIKSMIKEKPTCINTSGL